MKKKVINLFFKNHIQLTKTPGLGSIDATLKSIGEFTERKVLTTRDTVKKVSKLGFYYESTIYNYEEDESSSERSKVLKFSIGDDVYVLTYLVRYRNNTVSIDTRPWEIHPGDKSMPDHFVTDLLNLLDNYFIEVPEIQEYKSEVFTDLFGYPEGPKYQTNEEKILSHGFDLKESFRKPKES